MQNLLRVLAPLQTTLSRPYLSRRGFNEFTLSLWEESKLLGTQPSLWMRSKKGVFPKTPKLKG